MCGSKGVWGTGWDAVFSESEPPGDDLICQQKDPPVARSNMFESGDCTYFVVALWLGDRSSSNFPYTRVFQATDTSHYPSGHAQLGFDRRIVGGLDAMTARSSI